MLDVALYVTAGWMLVVGWLSWRKSLVHRDLADAYELVSRMLRSKDIYAAQALARQHKERKEAEGRWRSK